MGAAVTCGRSLDYSQSFAYTICITNKGKGKAMRMQVDDMEVTSWQDSVVTVSETNGQGRWSQIATQSHPAGVLEKRGGMWVASCGDGPDRRFPSEREALRHMARSWHEEVYGE